MAEMSGQRLHGLDLARYLAFVGMVIVNFKIVMGADASGDGLLGLFTRALEGRAAATFVVLAGVGLGLAALRSDQGQTVAVTLKRAAFLLVIGLLNTLIFDADILHYYAFYFLFGVFCLPLSSRTLVALIAAVNLVFLVMLLTLDYDAGWNWTDYTYEDFWTPAGFVRNLFFNGWHPVFPWLSFLLFGIWLSRLDLAAAHIQRRMIVLGIAAAVIVGLLSQMLLAAAGPTDEDLVALLGTAPVPPMPFYIIAGLGVASAVIGLCVRLARRPSVAGLMRLVVPAGRQTLTLYIAHILIGMGVLEALGLLGGQTLGAAVAAALIFCLAATLYAWVWSKRFKRGPVEALMRAIAG